MSAANRRPQGTPRPGQRVVLIIARSGLDAAPQRLSKVLDEVAQLGWVIAAIIDPAQQLDALRMVLNGLADVVVATRPEDLSVLRFSYDLGSLRSQSERRTQLLPRAGGETARRPQPVQPVAEVQPVADVVLTMVNTGPTVRPASVERRRQRGGRTLRRSA